MTHIALRRRMSVSALLALQVDRLIADEQRIEAKRKPSVKGEE